MTERLFWIAVLVFCGLALLRLVVEYFYARAVRIAINAQRETRSSRRRMGRAKWREDVVREAEHLLRKSEDELEQQRRDK